jgi:hypothetical protein
MKKILALIFLNLILTLVVRAQFTQQWEKRFDGTGNDRDDFGYNILRENSGNIYVSGRTYDLDQTNNAAIAKYGPGGNQIWIRKYNFSDEEASLMCFDKSGNILVVCKNLQYSNNLEILKYDTAGNLIKNKIFVLFYLDNLKSISCDNSNGFYIFGDAASSGTGLFVARFDQNFDTSWVWRKNNLSGAGSNKAGMMITDNYDNVYITGLIYSSTASNKDIVTAKIDKYGIQSWLNYINGSKNNEDIGNSLTSDSRGNIYITGQIYDSAYSAMITVKYSNSGSQLWVKKFLAPISYNNRGIDLCIDNNNWVYVFGYSLFTTTYWDYILVKYDTSGNYIWHRSLDYGTNQHEVPKKILADSSHNLYLFGEVKYNGIKNELGLAKYNSGGTLLWNKSYGGDHEDINPAGSFVLGENGSAYITCGIRNSGKGCDFSTIKTGISGDTVWARYINGLGINYDEAIDIVTDNNNNLYVLGVTNSVLSTSGKDCLVIKYNSSGDSIWKAYYHSPSDNSPSRMCYNNKDAVYFGGTCGLVYCDTNGFIYGLPGISSANDFVLDKNLNKGITFNSGNSAFTMVLNYADGTKWYKEKTGSANPYGGNSYSSFRITEDSLQNFYTFMQYHHWSQGSPSYYDLYIVKYDSTGTEKWTNNILSTANSNTVPVKILTDYSGSVYALGVQAFSTFSSDIILTKLSPAGTVLWTQYYNGTGNGNDIPSDMLIDRQNNIYICGKSTGIGTDFDFITLKYNSSGNLLWDSRTNGSLNSEDCAKKMTFGDSGCIIVTGYCNDNPFGRTFLTAKYSPEGNIIWFNKYHGILPGYDYSNSVTVSKNGIVYICGTGKNLMQNNDFITLKFSPPVGIGNSESGTPKEFRLFQNYPNPFNSESVIKYEVPLKKFIRIKMFDITGKETCMIFEGYRSPGIYEIKISSVNLASGVYFCRMEYEENIKTIKAVIIK